MTTNMVATKPELAIYNALISLGISFEFQSKMMGGRGLRGGSVADFLIPSISTVISCLGEYWHFAFRSTMIRDKLQQTALESQGWRVVYIDAEDALRNATYYVKAALRGISYSKFNKL